MSNSATTKDSLVPNGPTAAMIEDTDQMIFSSSGPTPDKIIEDGEAVILNEKEAESDVQVLTVLSKTLDNAPITCAHGKLSFEAISSMKRVSPVSYFIFWFLYLILCTNLSIVDWRLFLQNFWCS